jgi:hypothetical protein
MLNRLTVTLEHPEYAALLDVALAELRTPADQVRYMLRQELERRRLLPGDKSLEACPHSGRSAAPEIVA